MLFLTTQLPERRYLLDIMPTVSHAHSMRKIIGRYAGPVIRVRRSSDNKEKDIYFRNDVLNTYDLLSFCAGGNGYIVRWYDQGPRSLNLVQTTSAWQYMIVNAGVVYTSYGKPVLYMPTDLIPRIGVTYSRPIPETVITCGDASDHTNNGASRYIHRATTSETMALRVDPDPSPYYRIFQGLFVTSSVRISTTKGVSITCVFNGAESTIKVNNVRNTGNIGTTAANNMLIGNPNTGDTYTARFHVWEQICFPVSLSEPFITVIHNDQKQYYKF